MYTDEQDVDIQKLDNEETIFFAVQFVRLLR